MFIISSAVFLPQTVPTLITTDFASLTLEAVKCHIVTTKFYLYIPDRDFDEGGALRAVGNVERYIITLINTRLEIYIYIYIYML